VQEEAMKENTAAVHAQVPVDVATFLLNEKRSDIHIVEARLKVSVMLIPNIHLETPNYNITRVRHDEANEMGEAPLSYKMVEMPEETEAASAPSPETRPTRQQAAVQGIAPEQPAPMPQASTPQTAATSVPEADRPSIIRKIFGWFKRGEETERQTPTSTPEPVTQVQTKPAQGSQELASPGASAPREQRPERVERQRQERPRAESRDNRRRGEGRRGQDERRPNRRERDDSGQRHRPQQARREQPISEATNETAQQRAEPPEVSAAESGAAAQPGSRSRRRRGRRDRPERPDRAEATRSETIAATPGEASDQTAAGAAPAVAPQATADSPRPSQMPATASVPTAIGAADAGDASPIRSADTAAPAAESAPVSPHQAQTPAVTASDRGQAPDATASPAHAAPRYELPPDMVMIETSAEKRRAAPDPEATTDSISAPRRPRKPPQPAAEPESLVQVETRK
jgi:ribonuclease E